MFDELNKSTLDVIANVDDFFGFFSSFILKSLFKIYIFKVAFGLNINSLGEETSKLNLYVAESLTAATEFFMNPMMQVVKYI